MNDVITAEEFRAFINKPVKRSKYGSKITIVDDIRFDSKKESLRYIDLNFLQKAGKISALQRQVKFELLVDGNLICRYFADFVYLENGKQIVEDVKSDITRKKESYILKKKLMLALHKIKIQEV
jgi:hypothetical protein